MEVVSVKTFVAGNSPTWIRGRQTESHCPSPLSSFGCPHSVDILRGAPEITITIKIQWELASKGWKPAARSFQGLERTPNIEH